MSYVIRASSSTTSTGTEVARLAYERHGAELFRFARRWTGDQASAEDLVQDVMVQAWRSAESFTEQRGSLRTWLFAIARNVAVDHGRRSAARSRLVLAARDASPRSEDSPMDHVLLADQVARALSTLSPEHRVAIVETYLRDRGYPEVAAELGIPESTLRSRVFHGLRALRATMGAEEVDR